MAAGAFDLPAGELDFALQRLVTVRTVELEFMRFHSRCLIMRKTGSKSMSEHSRILCIDGLRLDEALKLRSELIHLHQAVNGPSHPHTFLVMHLLAAYYHDAGRSADALKLGEEVASHRCMVFGLEDPETLWSLANLAEYYARANRTLDALTTREEVLVLRRRILGRDHVDTLLAMERLALSYEENGRGADAARLREEQARFQPRK